MSEDFYTVPELKECVDKLALDAHIKIDLRIDRHGPTFPIRPLPWILKRLLEETGELSEALLYGTSPENIISECADIVVFASQIADEARTKMEILG